MLTDLLISQGEIGEARVELGRLKEQKANPEILKLLDARLSMLDHDWQTAILKLNAMTSSIKTRSAFQNMVQRCLGICHQNLGHHHHELLAYQRALEWDPLSGASRVGLAAALEKTGQIHDALFHYRQMTDWPGVSVAIARLEIVRNLQLPAEKRNWDQVEKDLNAAAGDPDNLVEVLLLRAEMKLALEESAEAQDILEAGIRRHPRDPALQMALVSVFSQMGDVEKAQGFG